MLLVIKQRVVIIELLHTCRCAQLWKIYLINC